MSSATSPSLLLRTSAQMVTSTQTNQRRATSIATLITCVRVRWEWLTFPAALAAFTILFFVMMIFDTRRGNLSSHHNWKSSPLPMMYSGFDRDATQHYNPAELKQVRDMEDHARHLRVRLVPTEKGWMFTTAQERRPGRGSIDDVLPKQGVPGDRNEPIRQHRRSRPVL